MVSSSKREDPGNEKAVCLSPKKLPPVWVSVKRGLGVGVGAGVGAGVGVGVCFSFSFFFFNFLFCFFLRFFFLFFFFFCCLFFVMIIMAIINGSGQIVNYALGTVGWVSIIFPAKIVT